MEKGQTVLIKLYKTQLQFGGMIDKFVVEPDGRGNGVITARTLEEQAEMEKSDLFKRGLIVPHNPVIQENIDDPFIALLTPDELYAVSLLSHDKKSMIVDNIKQVLKYNRIDIQKAVEEEMQVKAALGSKPDIESLMDVIEPISDAEKALLLKESKDELKIDKTVLIEEEKEKIEEQNEAQNEVVTEQIKDAAKPPQTIKEMTEKAAKKKIRRRKDKNKTLNL